MYLYGASGHAKVIIDILRANHEPIEALFDDSEKLYQLLNYPVLHSGEVRGPLIISIGNNSVRKKIAEGVNVIFGKAFHPSAIISEEAKIDVGTVVMQGAIIQSEVKIGKHCIINTGASVDHECILNDFVHISPHCTLCGNVEIGVAAPMPPRAAGALTRNRDTGISRANRRITPSSRAWMAKVWPLPSWRSTSTAF